MVAVACLLMARPAMLRLTNVNSFYGKAHILRDLSFEVARADVVALLGRNGAGKTTTMKSIMQLVRPRSGTIQFCERDITNIATHAIARLGLGYVPEDRRVFSTLTVAENLSVARQPEREGAPTWDLGQLFELFPNLAERAEASDKTVAGDEQVRGDGDSNSRQ